MGLVSVEDRNQLGVIIFPVAVLLLHPDVVDKQRCTGEAVHIDVHQKSDFRLVFNVLNELIRRFFDKVQIVWVIDTVPVQVKETLCILYSAVFKHLFDETELFVTITSEFDLQLKGAPFGFVGFDIMMCNADTVNDVLHHIGLGQSVFLFYERAGSCFTLGAPLFVDTTSELPR